LLLARWLNMMKKIALFAMFIPWMMLIIAYATDGVRDMGILWMAFGPLWIGFAIIVSYREGQWSRDRG
jgi:hypothetical protein